MVKDISSRTARYNLGNVSLSIDDFLKVLEEKGFKKVTARNKSMEFENLDDIKSNKALFSGDPTIYADNVMISFDRTGSYISSYGREADGDTAAKSLSEELIKYKSFLDRFSEIRVFGTLYIVAISGLFYLFSKKSKDIGISDAHAMYGSVVFIVYMTLALITQLWGFYSFAWRTRLFYAPTQGFIKRNMETIAVSAITGAIGLIIGSIFSSLSTTIQAWF